MNQVSYRQWVKRGIMMVNTESLEPDDPDHIYNQIAAQGVAPEDFGVENPYEQMFNDKSRSDLIKEILLLRKGYEGLARYYT